MNIKLTIAFLAASALLLPIFISSTVQQKTAANAGEDKTICKGGTVEIGTPVENSGDCFRWKPTEGLDNPNSPVTNAFPSKTTTYTLTVYGNGFSSKHEDEVEVKVVDYAGITPIGEKYEFDPDQPDWKFIEVGQVDHIEVNISPKESYENIFYNSIPNGIINFSPNKAFSNSDKITLYGVKKGKSVFEVNCGEMGNKTIAELNIFSMESQEKTVGLRLVNAKNYNSTNINYTALESHLNETVYNKVGVNWTVTELPPMTIDFDTIPAGGDNKLLIYRDPSNPSTLIFSEEMDIIINEGDDQGYDHIVFLVDNPSLDLAGVSKKPGRHSFVFVNNSYKPSHTVAHELGHATWGLDHENFPGNLMHEKEVLIYDQNELNKDQWFKIDLNR